MLMCNHNGGMYPHQYSENYRPCRDPMDLLRQEMDCEISAQRPSKVIHIIYRTVLVGQGSRRGRLGQLRCGHIWSI